MTFFALFFLNLKKTMATSALMAMPKSAIACTRSKCTRQIGLNGAGLCDGHACPVPNCTERLVGGGQIFSSVSNPENTCSKSSTEKWCPPHTAQSQQKMPKNFAIVLVNGVHLYLDLVQQTAQYNHPGPKGEVGLWWVPARNSV
jgi:hypothetical protein